MPPGTDDMFSNPVAPAGETGDDESEPHRLTNADFRKLMMTPRAPSSGSKESSASGASQVNSESASQNKDDKETEKNLERKKKKSYYARIKKEEEEFMATLAQKYRDRARERREGKNPDYNAEEASESSTGATGAYRAVAPDMKSGFDAAERRRQLIQESKFLGGDMEHTHLVKGLDYALLQKVRSEIEVKEYERVVDVATVTAPAAETAVEKKPAPAPVVEENEIEVKTSMGKRIVNAIFHSQPSEFNDSFLPGRLAYSIDLEDLETDIPITVLRSKSDLLDIENMTATFTTNDIVIQKLTQILSYLRTGKASKKQKKKDKGKEAPKGTVEDSIYGDIGDYVPSVAKPEKDRDKDRGRDRRDRDRRDRDKDRERDRGGHEKEERKRTSYFSRPPQEELRHERQTAEKRLSQQQQWPSGEAEESKQTGNPGGIVAQPDPKNVKGSFKKSIEMDDYYTECYPGMAEMQDAIEDSDDEADYTKMDLGNKKGPVGRWDFDTAEEYSQYMNEREAMPKAAFQYGVKMADGRKTRRIGVKEKDKNAELNREWQQIQRILKRRKDDGGGGGEKRSRYEY